MSETLSPGARLLLDSARDAAVWHSAERVELVHLLLALVVVPEGGAAQILRELGADTRALLKELTALAGVGNLRPSSRPELGPDVGRVLEHAREEASLAGQRLVSKEHVLAACLRVEGAASGVLARAGIDLESVRVRLWKRRPLTRDPLDVTLPRENAERPLRPRPDLSLAALEKKGFRKVKVLRAGDIHELVKRALAAALGTSGTALFPEQEEKLRAEVEKQFEAQQAHLQRIQELSDRNESARAALATREEEIHSGHEAVVRRLGEINATLSSERTALLEEHRAREAERSALELERARLELERARGELERLERARPDPALACPRGHGLMEWVVRGEVRVGVCPRCLSTAFEPGQLEALARRLGISSERLWQFLDPDVDRPGS